ncbi:MAG: TaqI-like C-terminal specificity domain-containing protein [Candidatus Hodarchaeales archaeon]
MSKHKNINFQKEMGAFYTPIPLVKELTRQTISQTLISQINEAFKLNFVTIDEIITTANLNIIKSLSRNINNLTILDGSAGDGRFLISASEYLISIHDEITKKWAKKLENDSLLFSSYCFNNIFGMEINLDALHSCHANLKKFFQYNQTNTVFEDVINKNVLAGDFLKSEIANWSRLSKHFQGFDIILGNPPWGSKISREDKNYFFDKFQLEGSKRNLNSFELFIYQSTNLLSSKNGMLGLYLPKNLARSNQYTNLRKFILNNYELYSLKFFELFQNVIQEFISIVGKKSSKIHPQHEILINNKRNLHQMVFQTNIDYIFTLEVDKSAIIKINLINTNSLPLEEYLTVKRGEELSKRGGIMFCPTCNTWVPLSSRKPHIECSHCHTILEKENVQTQFLINKTQTSEHRTPILTGEDFDRYIITGNHFFNNSVDFRTKKKAQIYRSPKLVVQKIKRHPWAAFDQNHTVTTQNVYTLHLKKELTSRNDLLFYILAILNSRLMTWYYENQFNLGSKFTNAISIRNLKRLPIKNPNINSELFLDIVEQVKKVIELKGGANRQSQIKNLDLLIFKLYGWKEDV